MVSIMAGGKQGDDCQHGYHDTEPLEEGAPGESPFLTAQHQNVTGEDPDIKQDDHRGSEQCEVKYIACGGDDRGQYDNSQNGVATVPDKECRVGDANQCQQEQEHG